MAKKVLSSLGEWGLIEYIRKQVGPQKASSGQKNRRVIRGIGDDAAVVDGEAGQKLLLTTDMLLEDVHFTAAMPALGVGHKSIAVSISDIAAMGGTPRWAPVSLGVPPTTTLAWIQAFFRGLKNCADDFKVSLVGGDTVKSRKMVINVTLVGEAESKAIVYRDGAKAGDQIFVTGALGASLKTGWHLRFVPRVREARYLVKHVVPTAMMDISDGLLGDLGHLLKQSHVGARLVEEHIPLRRGADLNAALFDGEDFELLFTLDPQDAVRLKNAKKPDYSFYPIGEITATKSCVLVNKKGRARKVVPKGFRHF